ncbi:MAG: DUF2135 domain-containing protein [Nannocystaceae bacterium]
MVRPRRPSLALGAPLALALTSSLGASGCKMADRESGYASYAKEDRAAAPGGGEGAAPGAVSTWRRSAQLPHASTLKVGDAEALELLALHAKVKVDGPRARVVLDYYYRNHHDRQLEGTFKVRLPEGASPYFFAFGETRAAAPGLPPAAPPELAVARAMGTEPAAILKGREAGWTGPKEARMVPKVKAAQAYGDTVRRAVDPALMEWAGAGVFSARVFPLAAQREHRIVFAYDVDLVAAGDDLELAFDLPPKLANVVVDVDAAELPKSAQTIAPAVEGERYDGRIYYRISRPQEPQVRLRYAAPPTVVLSGADVDVGPYFATSFVPALPAKAAAGGARRAVLMIDTSLSANPDAFNVWLKLAAALLAENRDAIDAFAVLFFNVEATWWRSAWTANTAEEAAALLADAGALALEGATDVTTALEVASAPPFAGDAPAPIDLFLLSDGAATWGEADTQIAARVLGEGRALFAYRTGLAGTDGAALDLLARESGGAVFSVVGEAEVAKAAKAHRATPWRLTSLRYEGASDLLVAGRPQALFPGQRLKLVGRGQPVVDAPIVLGLTQGTGDEAQAIEVTTTPAHAVASTLAPRAYGEVAVAQLEELGLATADTATPYALHFRVTGQSASLLMLESEEDYRRHNINPQADAIVVAKRLASAVVDAALAELGALLRDPKARFVAWMRSVGARSGVAVNLPQALMVSLEDAPAEAFTVPAERLAIKGRARDGLPPSYVTALAERELTYDMVNAEALRRVDALGRDDAIKAYSSLVEHSPGDAVLARDVGYSILQQGRPAQAYHLFRRVADARPFEPQSYRAMARALERADRPELAIANYEIGLGGRWDARFGDFETILRYDYVRLLGQISRGEIKTPLVAYAEARRRELSSAVTLGADLVVMITWNTDNTDVDLHVVEPSGEECYYSHPSTRSGGAISRDVTQGYGPEMYTLERAPAGKYQIVAHYFASDANRMSARTKVEVGIYEKFGTPQERLRERVVVLESGKDRHLIDTVEIGGAAIAR